MMNKIVRESLLESMKDRNHDGEDVSFVFELNPVLATIGSMDQYSYYLSYVFPESKVNNIVYHTTDRKNIQFRQGQAHFYMSKGSLSTKNAKFHSLKRLINRVNEDSANGNERSRYLNYYVRSNRYISSGDWKIRIDETFESLIDQKNINRFNKKYKANISVSDIMMALDPEIVCAILNVRNPYMCIQPINKQRVDEIVSKNPNIDAVIGGESWTINSTGKENAWGDIEVASEKEIVVFDPNNIYVLGDQEDILNFKQFLQNF